MKEHTLDILTAALIKYGTRVFWAAVIVFVGLRIIRIARRAAGQIMDRAGVEITLKKFLDMLLHAVLFGVMVFMAADQLGIKTTSFVAVIGTVTLAFSLAMQNTLSNFAGGTLILPDPWYRQRDRGLAAAPGKEPLSPSALYTRRS